MSQPISDVKIDLIVDTSPIKAIQVGEVTNQPLAFDIGEVPNLISNGLPAAGSTGQQLAKKSNSDYDTQWVTPHEIIAGGAAGQVLGKKSGTDYDTQWTNLPAMPIYDECDSLTPWPQWSGAGTASVATVADSSAGGKVIRCVGTVALYRASSLVPYDPTALYRVSFRVRQAVNSSVAGQSKMYAGLEGLAADGVTLVNTAGANSHGTQHNLAMWATPVVAADGWKVYTGYAKGVAAAGSNFTPSPTAPGQMHQNVRYIRPFITVNDSGDGTAEIDYVSLEIVPEPAYAQMTPLYDECGSLADWTTHSGTAPVVATTTDAGAAGGKVIRCTGINWMSRTGSLVPYDPTALYRIRFRVRQVTDDAGKSAVYLGLTGVAADGVTLVNTAGANLATSAQHYVAAAGVSLTVAGGWQDFVGYVKGVAATGSSVAAPSPGAPAVMHQSTRYIRPLLAINFNGTAGVAEIDYVSLEIVPPTAVANSTEVTLSGDGAGTPLSAALTGTRSGQLTVNGNLSSVGGNVYLGTPTDQTQRNLSVQRLGANGTDVYRTDAFVADDQMLQLYSYKAGAYISRVFFNQDGSISVSTKVTGTDINRPIPFATWVGRFSVVLSSATFGTAALTLPTGRFTAATTDVGIYATSINQVYSAYISSFTATSFTVGVRHLDNTAASATIAVAGLVVQQTPSGLGRAVERVGEPNLTTVLATCHTGGCDNVDVVVPVEIVDENTSIGCGVCFQPITDVTTP